MDQDIRQSTHASRLELQRLATASKFRNTKDDWTVIGSAALNFQRKGATRFTIKRGYEYPQAGHDEEQHYEHHEARGAS